MRGGCEQEVGGGELIYLVSIGSVKQAEIGNAPIAACCFRTRLALGRADRLKN